MAKLVIEIDMAELERQEGEYSDIEYSAACLLDQISNTMQVEGIDYAGYAFGAPTNPEGKSVGTVQIKN